LVSSKITTVHPTDVVIPSIRSSELSNSMLFPLQPRFRLSSASTSRRTAS
jgi:hypothetical protein